jgi:hypothetical protein
LRTKFFLSAKTINIILIMQLQAKCHLARNIASLAAIPRNASLRPPLKLLSALAESLPVLTNCVFLLRQYRTM